MRIKVDSGKYTFLTDSYHVHVLRHGEPWIEDMNGSNALFSMMSELDAARYVLAEVRRQVSAGVDIVRLISAIEKHDRLVSDIEPPSAWSDPNHPDNAL